MKQWHHLGIRTQLILLLSLLLFLVLVFNAGLAYWQDMQQRRNLALEQAETLAKALNQDLLRILISPSTDMYSDVSFRLEGFKALESVLVQDASGQSIYEYRRHDNGIDSHWLEQDMNNFFSDHYLYSRQAIESSGYSLGTGHYMIDLSRYHTGLREELESQLYLFPLELMAGILLAWWLSRRFTRPFTRLARAMKESDVRNNHYAPVDNIQAFNEIGVLYDGYRNLTERVQESTRELTFLSEHDNLTGLHNRYAIERFISTSLRDDSQHYALALLDIDQFKLINDSVGHLAGDELLKQLTGLFHNRLDSDCEIARVSADDFFILMSGRNEDEAVAMLQKIMDAIQVYRFSWQGQIFMVTASAGLVCYKANEYSLAELVKTVDSAFYRAKNKGRNQVHVHHREDEDAGQYDLEIRVSGLLKEALHEGPSKFELYAQSIVPLQGDSQGASYEILLRLINGDGELVSPGDFLHIASKFQMLVEIDIHVIRKYLEQVKANPAHLNQLDFVNINLSGSSLNHPDFQKFMESAIKHYHFPWEKLVMEVTETSAVGNLSRASAFLQSCRDRGIRIALDDFGTGMASFEYLKHLKLDMVKIDGAFIRDMLEDELDMAMVRYAHDISKLGKRVTVAEFVENEEQRNTLREIGIDYGQGYYLGKPEPLKEILKTT